MNKLKEILNKGKIIRALEAHSGLSALLVEKSKYSAIWVSSLTHSASKGLPDTELVSLEERIDLVKEIRRVAKKPIIVDVDTGGGHFGSHAKWFKQVGADALIIEDKAFPKQNSLLENGKHNLEDVDKFCEKIKDGKKSGIIVIARLESLIAKHSIYEALIRAEAYEKAGVDGIVIHSKQQIDCSEVMEFAKKFREQSKLLLIAIPSVYDLPKDHPFDIIIYANMMLRASLKAMEKAIEDGDIKEANMSTIQDIFDIVGS